MRRDELIYALLMCGIGFGLGFAFAVIALRLGWVTLQ